MPCNGDYLEPTQSEEESKRCAEILVYVHKKLKLKIPDYVTLASEDCYGNSDKLNEMVVLLCSLCTKMSKKQQNDIIYNAKDKMSRRLADWWEEHQEADRIRIQKEIDKEKKEVLKTQGLTKLTKEEREALGL